MNVSAAPRAGNDRRPRCPGAPRVKFLGFMLLLAGWIIVVTAVAMLPAGTPRAVFALAGVGVEILGLALIIRAQPAPRGERD